MARDAEMQKKQIREDEEDSESNISRGKGSSFTNAIETVGKKHLIDHTMK